MLWEKSAFFFPRRSLTRLDIRAVRWTQVTNLMGDFEQQNKDVKYPGTIAPWYERHGHTLTALDRDGDGEDDIMVLAGGFAPVPANDVWVTEDGVTWRFVQHAPWSPRAWHAAVVFNHTLYVMGGTPLNNEVWRMSSIAYDGTRWHMQWQRIDAEMPWSPRSGLQVVRHFGTTLPLTASMSEVQQQETMVLTGGYGGWPVGDSRYDAFRCRNDVWSSTDGKNWALLTNNAPWAARAWHGFSTWGKDGAAWEDRFVAGSRARMWMVGGAYIGQKGTAVVYNMYGYVDTWWSRNGVNWTRVSYEEGVQARGTRFSTDEWAKTAADGVNYYLGLWGHTLPVIKNPATNITELVIVGGNQAPGEGSLQNKVWTAREGVACNQDGITCTGRGSCAAATALCQCFKPQFGGEYCELGVGTEDSATRHRRRAAGVASLAVLVAATLLMLC